MVRSCNKPGLGHSLGKPIRASTQRKCKSNKAIKLGALAEQEQAFGRTPLRKSFLLGWSSSERQVRVFANGGSTKEFLAKVREEVQTIQQSIEAATEERYLEGLQAAREALKLIYSPPAPSFQAAPEQKRQEQEQARKRREMEEDKNHGKKPEMPQMVPRADLEGIRAEGSGREVLLQAFHWESHHQGWWRYIPTQAQRFADFGFTVVWLPPPTTSVSPQGYMPLDLYNLNSRYGSEEELRKCINSLHDVGLKVLSDIVINHRCASKQDGKGIWNNFGGKMDWDARAIVSDDRKFAGRGGPSSGDPFPAAPNIDHTQTFVKADIKEWLQWMRDYMGFDGWRFDFVRGYSGVHAADYVAATAPEFNVGEFWDSLAYDGSVPRRNQDAHRQRTVNWLNQASGASTAFDVTTKGILHAVFERNEFWRLKDGRGNPPGLLGWWPSRSVTFLENHDTGSTQGHWRFPNRHLEEGHCYILTHPGTPAIFLDHLDDVKLADVIKQLIAVRKKAEIHARSKVDILKADDEMYAARIDDRLLMKIGAGSYKPEDASWKEAASGKRWQVWLKE